MKKLLFLVLLLAFAVPAHADDSNLSMLCTSLGMYNYNVGMSGTTYTSSTATTVKIGFNTLFWLFTGTTCGGSFAYQISGDCINWTSPIEAASITSAGYYCSGVSPFNTITSTTVNLPYIRFMLTTATATTSDLYVKGRFYKK